MRHSKAAGVLRWAAPLCAGLLAVIRTVILKTAFDPQGLLPRGSRALLWTVLASALVFGGLWLLSLRLNRLPGTEDCFSRGPLWLFLRLAAGILVSFGGVMALLEGSYEAGSPELLGAWGGIAAGLLLIWTCAVPAKPWVFWFRVLPALFTGAALVLRFRNWSHDPLVIHILPPLLAWTCCMVEMTLISGFSLGAGHRRSGVLFGLAAGVFACMTLPDFLLGLQTELPELLTLGGLALWCALAGFDLLRAPVQSQTPDASGG